MAVLGQANWAITKGQRRPSAANPGRKVPTYFRVEADMCPADPVMAALTWMALSAEECHEIYSRFESKGYMGVGMDMTQAGAQAALDFFCQNWLNPLQAGVDPAAFRQAFQLSGRDI